MANKTQSRIEWAKSHKHEIESARVALGNNSKNAARCSGYSDGGWGLWANALEAAGIKPDRGSYWSGSFPTPSTAINAGIAKYISSNAPAAIR
jgi:hypothetical protein